MDPYMAQMSPTLTPEEEMRALAESLRGSAGRGAQLSTSSLEPVQAQGRLMQTRANSQADAIGLQNYRAKKMEMDEKDSVRDNQRLLSAAKRSDPFAKMSNKGSENFEQKAQVRRETINIIDQFEEGYAGRVPLLGEAEIWLGNKGLGDEKSKRTAEWWANWRKFYENPERNALFGSALTEAEQRAWAASNISPDMEDDEIQSRLDSLRSILQQRARYDVSNVLTKNEDYAPYVDSVYQDFDFGEEGEKPRVAGEGEVDLQSLSLEELRKLAGQ